MGPEAMPIQKEGKMWGKKRSRNPGSISAGSTWHCGQWWVNHHLDETGARGSIELWVFGEGVPLSGSPAKASL